MIHSMIACEIFGISRQPPAHQYNQKKADRRKISSDLSFPAKLETTSCRRRQPGHRGTVCLDPAAAWSPHFGPLVGLIGKQMHLLSSIKVLGSH
jgi:hypothetical protein